MTNKTKQTQQVIYSSMIADNDRTAVQITRFILPLIIQQFIRKFSPQCDRVFAKIFIDGNTSVFQKHFLIFFVPYSTR